MNFRDLKNLKEGNIKQYEQSQVQKMEEVKIFFRRANNAMDRKMYFRLRFMLRYGQKIMDLNSVSSVVHFLDNPSCVYCSFENMITIKAFAAGAVVGYNSTDDTYKIDFKKLFNAYGI